MTPREKTLPLPGEVFGVAGCTAFLIAPAQSRRPRRWVWYAPALPTLPGPEEVCFALRLPGWGLLYFGGDARLDRAVLAALRRRLGAFRLVFLPVGGTRIFGRRTVMDPAGAAEAARILGAAWVVPIHEGGIWLPVPPASWHPGRARHLPPLLQGEGPRVRLLAEGEEGEF